MFKHLMEEIENFEAEEKEIFQENYKFYFEKLESIKIISKWNNLISILES